MKSINLLEEIEFNDTRVLGQAILADKNNRIIRFALKAGQCLKEHRVPSSAVRIIVIKGSGVFSGEDNKGVELGPQSLIIFEPNEAHSVQALDMELVFVAILQGSPELKEAHKPVGLLQKE